MKKYLKKVFSIARIKKREKINKKDEDVFFKYNLNQFLYDKYKEEKKMRRTEENEKIETRKTQRNKEKNAETLAAVHTHTHKCFKE